ncbi:ribosome-inactivating protein saporin-4-like [Silene latifolia]|uniref:ribosome-inactivating protein saporin-4-like n=1 Tax=Silene latifolia TaxID=37657 RepID=UPI003D776DC0
MKAWLIVLVTWTIVQSSALIANAIALDLANPTQAGYSNFLTAIRNNVKDPKLNYGGTGIPVIGAPTATATYLRIDLTVATGTVSLGLKRSDLYVVAYLARNDRNVFRSYYFNSSKISSAQLDKLFPEAKGTANQQPIIEYDESYKSLESTAKMSRQDAGLGISKLVSYLEAVNRKARNVPAEAKFIMVGVEMVSEATRSGYIQELVLDVFPNGFSPGDDVIIMERNWARISKAIKDSNKGVFTPPLVLESPGITTNWTVNNAAELNMGLLKFVQITLLESTSEENYAEI